MHVQMKDILQLMIDAKTEAREKLSDDQIVAHSATFLLAGYETTSTALSYIAYELALHPAIQHTLQQYIDNYYRDNPVSILCMSCWCHGNMLAPLRAHLSTTLLKI